MTKYPKVSIIIPLYVVTDRFFQDLKKFKNLNYPNYEILVVCDKKVKINDPKIKLVLTGKKRTGPAEKRDIAIKKAKGTICAFIDDDAYPEADWLKNSIVHFNHPLVAGVGGPGITPLEDNFWEQVTGLIYHSYFCGGPTQHRFKPAKMAFVEDYPAYNLLIRKDVLKKVGGYGSHFYGGEDTFLCLKIIQKGYKIIYDPSVVVYHHRRALLKPYLKQIANIGKHRGYFAKKFPETSRMFFYFLPSILAVGFFILPIFSIKLFLFVLLSFLLIGMVSLLGKGTLIKVFFASIGIILTHLTYGISFVEGVFLDDI